MKLFSFISYYQYFITINREQGKLNIIIMNEVKHENTFSIVSFLDRPSGTSINVPDFQPHTVKRISDGKLFSIGDVVSNGMWYDGKRCIGKITGFSLLDKTIFVNHDYNGVGWGLEDVSHVVNLPSAFQPGDSCQLQFGAEGTLKNCTVVNVHFSTSKVKYDVEVTGNYDGSHETGEEWHTRLYNVDSAFVKKA